MIEQMAYQTFEQSDAYGLVDIDDAPVVVGPLRCARKVLQRTTTDLARHATYALAFHGIDGSGGAAALNYDRASEEPSPISAFTKELAGWASTNHFAASAGLGFLDGELDGTLHPSGDWLEQLEATSARASLPGVYSIVVASDDEESTLIGPYMIPTIDHQPDLAAALTSGADAVFVRAGTGALDHEVLADVNVKYIVGLQPLTTTARGLATAAKQGCVVIPDFISLAGPYIAATLGEMDKADILDHVTNTVRTARNRVDDAGIDTFVRACELAEDHIRTWTSNLPFGRPLAP